LRRNEKGLQPAEAGARIVALYEAWGKHDKADAWRKKLGDVKLP
jgi:hypothetical protein